MPNAPIRAAQDDAPTPHAPLAPLDAPVTDMPQTQSDTPATDAPYGTPHTLSASPAADAPRPVAPPRRKQPRERLDVLLTARGLAPSRERARALIMAGEVRVNGARASKAGEMVAPDAAIELVGPNAELRFVSRGGLKLERALDAFALDPTDCVALDVGASTGGFTDLLLRRGARTVYAVDVGHGQLAWALRSDPRVVVMERTNIRHLVSLPESMDCAVIDVSFISLRLVLPAVARLLAPGGWVVALVKPQFEAGRAEADKGAGVIRDPAIHRRILRELLAWLADMEAPKRDGDAAPERPGRLVTCGLVASPITGRDGNHEYLLWLRSDGVTSQDYGDDAKRDTIPPEATTRGDEREQRDGLDEAEIARVVAAAFHEKT
jgi:23S rRNA (cytidine1920-2'-O)/16S rRNA (cytidine1409-2'-O)-methyltransferase